MTADDIGKGQRAPHFVIDIDEDLVLHGDQHLVKRGDVLIGQAIRRSLYETRPDFIKRHAGEYLPFAAMRLNPAIVIDDPFVIYGQTRVDLDELGARFDRGFVRGNRIFRRFAVVAPVRHDHNVALRLPELLDAGGGAFGGKTLGGGAYHECGEGYGDGNDGPTVRLHEEHLEQFACHDGKNDNPLIYNEWLFEITCSR